MTGTTALDTRKIRDRYEALRTGQRPRITRRSRCAVHGDLAARHLLSTVPVLCDELDDLRATLGLAQRDHYDLVAAARATLAAAAEGEPDHLYYLRDELSARGLLPRRRGDQLW